MKEYQLGEVMSDADSLAHYGVRGMKWGKTRAKGGGLEIRTARRNVRSQRREIKQLTKDSQAQTTSAGKKSADATLAKAKTTYLKNPDRVLAARLTRGEKLASAVLLTPIGAAAAIAGTSARSRTIEGNQESNSYD